MMKKNIELTAIILLIFLAGCTVSKMDTTSMSSKYDKEGTQVIKEKPYKVSVQDNIVRTSFVNTDGDVNDIEITFDRSMNGNTPRDFTFHGSSGDVVNSPTFKGFKEVEFPFTGSVNYYIKPRLIGSTSGGGKGGGSSQTETTDLRCRLTFTINEPGSWTIRVTN